MLLTDKFDVTLFPWSMRPRDYIVSISGPIHQVSLREKFEREKTPLEAKFCSQELAGLVAYRLRATLAPYVGAITLYAGHTIYVAQYDGPPLPRGATQVPHGGELVFWKISVLT